MTLEDISRTAIIAILATLMLGCGPAQDQTPGGVAESVHVSQAGSNSTTSTVLRKEVYVIKHMLDEAGKTQGSEADRHRTPRPPARGRGRTSGSSPASQ